MRVTFLLLLGLLLNITTYSQKELYGLSEYGGAFGNGTIFKINRDGTAPELIIDLPLIDAEKPGDNAVFHDGKVLFTSVEGGADGDGTIVEYDTLTKTTTVLYSFNHEGDNFRMCSAGLMKLSDGRIVGVASAGGKNGKGAFFEFDYDLKTISTIYDFTTDIGYGQRSLFAEDIFGILYGISFLGGANGDGVLYKLDLNDTSATKLIDFSSVSTGQRGYATPTISKNGHIYGVLYSGGTHGSGTVFKYDTTGKVISKIYHLNPAIDGGYSQSGLVNLSNGLLVGCLTLKGVNNAGTIIQIDDDLDQLTVIHDFKADLAEGAYPKHNLVELASGNLLGTAGSGGANGNGTIFEYDFITDTVYVKVDFDDKINGRNPKGNFLTDGENYWSTTREGGNGGGGVLFQYQSNNNKLSHLSHMDYAELGKEPSNNLILASNGKIYASTREKGNSAGGTILEIDPITKMVKKIVDLDDSTGHECDGGLLEASNGKLYGTTDDGGRYGAGTIFELDLVLKSVRVVHHFVGNVTGNSPKCQLMEASNGKLYGATAWGGIADMGTVFSYDLYADDFQVLHQFSDSTMGFTIESRFAESGGKIYALTTRSRHSDTATVVSLYLSNNVVIKELSFFKDSIGSSLFGGFVTHPNGNLIALSGNKGRHNSGAIISYDPLLNVIESLHPFDIAKGEIADPEGYPFIGLDNNIYVLGEQGGIHNEGGVAMYDMVSGEYTNLFSLDTVMGENGTGAVVGYCPKDQEMINETICRGDSIKVGDFWVYQTGIFKDTVSNIWGCDSIVVADIVVNALDTLISFDNDKFISSANGVNYQWVDCDLGTNIQGGIMKELPVDANGSYKVIVDDGFCVDSSSCIDVRALGVVENSILQEVTIFPNPAREVLTINNSTNDNATVVFIDNQGRVVLQTIIGPGQTSLNVDALAIGTYNVRINIAEKGEKIEKLVKL